MSKRVTRFASVLSPRFFKALCEPTRIKLLERLAAANEPCSVGRLAECCPVDMSVVSRHLAILRDAGVIESERRGKQVLYRVRARSLAQSLRALADVLDPITTNEESARAK